MAQIPFLGPTYAGRSSNINASRCVNFYPEINQQDKTVLALVGTPGTTLLSTIGTFGVRGMHTFNNLVYIVSGNKLYSMNAGGTVSASLGTLTTSGGRVVMVDNGLAPTGGNQILIVDGSTSAYIFNVKTSTFTTLGSGTWAAAVVAPTTATFIGGYFVITGTGLSYQVSALYDGLTWSGLDVAAKGVASDVLLNCMNNLGLLWLFGRDSTEVWSQGVGHPPFTYVQGSASDFGLAAQYSVAKGGGTMFWLANQIQSGTGELIGVVMANGYSAQLVSPQSMNWAIKQYSTVADAFGYCYTDEGHIFYVLTFPTANATWCYDLTTQMWHERSTYALGPYVIGRHVGNAYSYLSGNHFIGDWANGNIYTMASSVYTDNNKPIISMRTSQHQFGEDSLNNFVLSKIQIDAETGVGDNTTLSPKASLSWSDDGGHTFSSEYQANMGAIGQYKTRLIWRRIGYSRDRVFRLIISDPVKKILLNAYAQAVGEKA